MGNINLKNESNASRDINLAGRDIIHNHNYPRKKEELLMNPHGPDNELLEMAEMYWEFITGKKNRLGYAFILPLVLSILAGQDYFLTKQFSNIYLTLGGIVLFILLFSVLVMKQSNTCPSCGGGFATKEISRKLLNHRLVRNTWITNLEVTRKCRKCNYTYKKPLIIEEPVEEIYN